MLSLHVPAASTCLVLDRIGLRAATRTRPTGPASYAVSVRQGAGMPPTSFRLRLATDALVLGSWLVRSTPIRDFHPKAQAHAGHTSDLALRRPGHDPRGFHPTSHLLLMRDWLRGRMGSCHGQTPPTGFPRLQVAPLYRIGPRCGHTDNADPNATVVIAKRGIQKLRSEVTPGEIGVSRLGPTASA